jgi:hypothetical protein
MRKAHLEICLRKAKNFLITEWLQASKKEADYENTPKKADAF